MRCTLSFSFQFERIFLRPKQGKQKASHHLSNLNNRRNRTIDSNAFACLPQITANYFQSLVFFCCAGIPHCAISLIRRQNGKMGGGHGIKLSDSLRDALLGPSIVKRFWQKSGGGQKKQRALPGVSKGQASQDIRKTILKIIL